MWPIISNREALAVNEDTLDTHIALGSVLRKRGEVDRDVALRIAGARPPSLSHSLAVSCIGLSDTPDLTLPCMRFYV